MIPALAALLLSLPGAAPPGGPNRTAASPPGANLAPAGASSSSAPVVRQEGIGPEKEPVPLATPDDVKRLCRALEPAERVRSRGDALERGEAEARHGTDRAAALKERYAVTAPAGKIAFAPYDGSERRLALQEPVQLAVAEQAARLWPTEARALAVEADAVAARRVLDAQRRGTLTLSLVFDLPEDATCGSVPRGKTFTLPIEPVAWRWLDGDAALAHGGAAAERPLVSAAQGARPRVEVGDPIMGPADLRKTVAARSRDLEACYAEALKKDPATDGILVADLGGPRAAISADSVGNADLAACVQRALSALAPAQGGKAAVPIRFELALPGEPEKAR